MSNPDLTTVIVVGAVVGIFFVALGHAQMVWLSRRRSAPRNGSGAGSSFPRRWLERAFAVLAVVSFVRAAATRGLPERDAFLTGEDLFAVRPRHGLVARYETRSAEVRRGEPLIRFAGPDGQEARVAVENRRRTLQGQLEGERARPLDLDSETLRRADDSQAALHRHEHRLEQLVSERDAILREVAQQRLAMTGRQFRIEQDDRTAERELEPLRVTLETERDALRSQEELLVQGAVSRMDTARVRDAVSKLEGRVRQLEEQRTILAREEEEVARLRAFSEKILERQLAARDREIAEETAQAGAARRALAFATGALDEDRPRALAQREKRLRELETEIEECNALLEGRGSHALVEAPFDGRVGFREPSPASAPADGGPLLVLYPPGKVGATVRLESGQAEVAGAVVSAVIQVPPAGWGDGRPEAVLRGDVVERTVLPDGATELRIACDPPDRVVRQLAMGGSVRVVAHLTRSVTRATSFRVGLASAAVALAVALHGALRGRGRRRDDQDPPSTGWSRPDDAAPGGSVPGTPAVANVRRVWPRPAVEPPAAATTGAPAPNGEEPLRGDVPAERGVSVSRDVAAAVAVKPLVEA